MRKEVEKRQQEEEASKVMGRYAWRQWPPGGRAHWHDLTPVHMLTSWGQQQDVGGQRSTFHWRGEPLRPWVVPEDKDTRHPKARLWGAPGFPGHILTLSLPFAFPQPLQMAAVLGHQKATWKIMKIQSRRARIWRSCFLFFHIFKIFSLFLVHRLFFVTLPSLLLPSFSD